MNLQELITHVAQRPEVRSSLTDLFRGLAELIREHQEEPLKLEALADDLDDSRETVALAVVANTPVAPSGIGSPLPGSLIAGPGVTFSPFGRRVVASVDPALPGSDRSVLAPPVTIGALTPSEIAAQRAHAADADADAALEEKRLEEQRDAGRIAEKTSGDDLLPREDLDPTKP